MYVMFDINVKHNICMLYQSNVPFISKTEKCILQDKYKSKYTQVKNIDA